ncbi:MAG TPA: adenylate/guanylate cyclase domain-containing protein [Nitrososphaerales archaeon]|nr:adenylate/guanylate cyclase domain-containing protein [Nitrososphaerales archaeon]
MFTDMVGYTALGQRDETLSLALVEEQRKLVRPTLTKHNGREVKTIGDAFLVEFSNAVDAVRCAYDIQRTIREFNLSIASDKRIHLRIGVHVGEVVESSGDISGDAVNLASRIEPIAEDGGVCLTRQVYDHVKHKIDLPLSSLGPRSLKNVTEPTEVYKLVMPWNQENPVSSTELDKRRIAILPFANMSPDPNDEFFADGLTEEMIGEFSKIQGLRVIARTSVMHYKDSSKGVQEIARELNVGSVLEGSVRKSGTKVRITAQLINASNEEHLWTDKYDRELNDIFAVQSEIASNVADSLKMKFLTPSASPKREPENLEAYTLYLRGRFLWNKRTPAAVQEALNFFKEASAKDPAYARAYTGIADCYSILVDRNNIPWSVGAAKGREACRKALELDDGLSEAHASMGLVLMRDFDYAGAEREFKRAIELNADYAPTYNWYSLALAIQGKMSEGRRIIEMAEEADPLSPVILHNSGYVAWVNGEDAKAVEKWTRGLEVDPGFDVFHLDMAAHYITNSLIHEAIDELKTLDANPNATALVKAQSAFLYGCLGDREEAQRRLLDFLSEAENASVPAGQIAWIYAGLGDADKFYEWAMKSVEDRSLLPVWVRTHPLLAKMRLDSRYPEFLDMWKVQP